MANPPPAWYTYAEQLVHRDHGLPLWHPEPELKPPLGSEPDLTAAIQRSEIHMGDVGWVYRGQFMRLFNAMCPASDALNRNGVPDNFEPLELSDAFIHANRHSRPDSVQGPIMSTGIKNKGPMQLRLSDPAAFFGTSFQFSSTQSRGAAAILGRPGHEEFYVSNAIFKNYIVRNHASWYQFAVSMAGYAYPPASIIFISGWVKTSHWAIAALADSEGDVQFSLSAAAGLYVAASAEFSMRNEVRVSMEQRWGPPEISNARSIGNVIAPDAETPSTGPISGPSIPQLDDTNDPRTLSPHESSLPCNQCLFIRYYKFKSRIAPLRPAVSVQEDVGDITSTGDEQFPRQAQSDSQPSSQGRVSTLLSKLPFRWRLENVPGNSQEATGPDDNDDTLYREYSEDPSLTDILSAADVDEVPPAGSHTSVPDHMDDVLDLMLEARPEANAAIICYEDLYSIFPPEKYLSGLQKSDIQERFAQGLQIHLDEDHVASIGHADADNPMGDETLGPAIHTSQPSTPRRSEGRDMPSGTMEVESPYYHTFLTVEDTPGVVIPQKAYVASTPFDRRASIVFPRGTFLWKAEARHYVDQPDYRARPITSTQDKLKFTLRLAWPGYRPWNRVIQGTERSKYPEPEALGMLAKRVADAIRAFYQIHAEVTPSEPDWAVTRIPFEKLILVELRHVSEGSWQPVLCYDPSN